VRKELAEDNLLDARKGMRDETVELNQPALPPKKKKKKNRS